MTVRKGYESEMARARQVITDMGDKSVAAIRAALGALVTGKPEMAELARQYEKEIDALYEAIDEELITTIATQQPLASDLRFIVASLKLLVRLKERQTMAIILLK